MFGTATWSQLNANVALILVFNLLWSATRTLWETGNISALIFLLEDRHKSYVGFAASVEGITQLVVAIPGGMLADRWRRDTVLRLAACLSVASLLFTAYAVHACDLTLVYMAMAAWGASYALNDAPMEALFADSTPTGLRADIFVAKFVLMQVGRGIGSAVIALLFLVFGDVWEIHELQQVLYVGLALTVIPAVMQAFVSDDRSLNAESEATLSAGSVPLLSAGTKGHSNIVDPPRLDRWVVTFVPATLAISDLMTALGAGATVKFFPLFFIEEFDMKPVEIGVIFAITPFACSLSSLGSAWVARRFGRINAIIIAHMTGTVLLVVFAACTTVTLAVFVFILRAATMNSFKPLKRSVLMDIIPKKSRGTWNSLESVTIFSWTGSAAIGGIVVDQWGYRTCFLATAALYAISCLPIMALSYWNLDRHLDISKPAAADPIAEP
ncbi:unnamed protein product (mitochondrion) [Plasmodiophora brassicae]|uniref:Major facilitator superfamily (MFS) profile domain-containing protein n=1 Tax=Plasmodiophora brassicae TaxID=37360 RepID=A0A3P3Y176_PLABS|nr:unnamed protein product [Plasmodiophora brassicae]